MLTVEQRHLAKGNGGIFFAITVPDKIWPTCVEVQGQSGECGDLRVSEELKVSAEPAGRVQGKRIVKLSESSEKPIGEWDTIEITVDRGNITVKVNGQLQNVATSAADLTGTIGLQSEGSAMEFRKVELRPIEQEVR